MTTLHLAADSEGDAIRASDDTTAERVSAPLTRREARARERAATLAHEQGAAEIEAGVLARAAVIDPAASVVSSPVLPAPVDGPAVVESSAVAGGRRAARAAERSERRVTPPTAKRAPRASAARPAASRPAAARTAAARPAVASRPAAVRRTAALPGRTRRQTAAQHTTRWGVAAAMVFVGATIVSTSVPANAYFVDTPDHVAVKLAAAAQSGTTVGGEVTTPGQNFVASGAVSSEDLDRDGYSVTSQVQAIKNTSTGTFSNDSSAAVQWPFAVGVPISSGFGSRQVANCSFCSTFHEGLDFIPGAGSPIQIIADGTVSKVDQGSGALGYNVWIEHTIGGKKVTSVYAHMIAGSIKVTQGEQVRVGQVVGLVGSTGNSTGAHLHFEIHLDGVPVDPYPWLEANAGQR